MFTAYLYKSSDVESACKQFLNDNFQETYLNDILETLDCTEFVQGCLLKEEYLDGEILEDEGQIAICIKKSIDGFDINSVNPNRSYPLQE